MTRTHIDVLDRALTLLGDLLVIGVMVLAVNIGLLDHEVSVMAIGWAMRSLLHPSISLSPDGNIAFAVHAGEGGESRSSG